MKKYLLIVSVFFLLSIFSFCTSPSESDNPPERPRTGAVCKDGTTSTATGSGACSNHGGVAYWLY